MTKDEYIECVNTIAFYIHECSLSEEDKWNNDIFVRAINNGTNSFITREMQVEIKTYGPITTILGDTFGYWGEESDADKKLMVKE